MSVVSPGYLLRTLREERGWGIKVLASKLRVNPSTITRWEQGRHIPRTDYAHAIQALLGLDSLVWTRHPGSCYLLSEDLLPYLSAREGRLGPLGNGGDITTGRNPAQGGN